MQKIKECLIETICELTDFTPEEITDQTELTKIHLVSLDFVTIQVELKKQLNINIDLNDLSKANLETFQDLVHYVHSKL
ncbi:Acyl carrier protein (AcpP) (PDB:1ACP) [Commensalibacter communis]|uniref:acyl carrier protein n=1 Tax=Commensalibacter communis TaxID=2972786 RepID=UPI0022FF7A37|nr:acyl carrier protein [Commensalibacter communis]CAI3954239.1 Acyl carrier protein (AcpP) (PDB:1ACP) [Commensalibacter communis]CAI3955013.1 Acyl carrier protein (AcpP) (PDB:1ACP) [Commensalibacter communis]